MRVNFLKRAAAALAAVPFAALPVVGQAAKVTNPICPTEFALFNPDDGSDIVIEAPHGTFKVSVFAKDLNSPTGIAFAEIPSVRSGVWPWPAERVQ
jgi:hypothetical protein